MLPEKQNNKKIKKKTDGLLSVQLFTLSSALYIAYPYYGTCVFSLTLQRLYSCIYGKELPYFNNNGKTGKLFLRQKSETDFACHLKGVNLKKYEFKMAKCLVKTLSVINSGT